MLELETRHASEARRARERAPSPAAPLPPAIAQVLALQRSAGNAQVARLLQRQAHSPAEPAQAEEEDEAARAHEVFDELQESVELGEHTHTLSVRMEDGEPDVGVASKWKKLAVIDQQIRARVQVMGTPYPDAWRAVSHRHAKLKDAKQKLEREEAVYTAAMRKWKSGRRQLDEPSSSKVDSAVTALRIATNHYTGEANRFLRVAYDTFGEQVALILGELVPTHEKDPLPTGNYGGRRYHTGTQADPIPIVWYKPAANYLPITLDDYNAAGVLQGQRSIVLNYPNWPARTVNVPDGQGRMLQYNLGVNATNQINVGSTVRNNHPVVTRARQQELNWVLGQLGFVMGNRDGDHVKDLGFEGQDHEDNFWPLDRAINQSCLLWRRVYRVHFKEQQGANWVLKSRPIDGLQGKYFYVKGSAATPQPPESSQPDAGHHGNAWGVQTGVMVNGALVPEI